MTSETVAPKTLHAWAICLRAGEEARRRGDRRYGTDHILLALFEDPSIEAVLGASLEQARQALDLLDHEALSTLGLDSGSDAPPCRCAPCQRNRGSGTWRKRIVSASRRGKESARGCVEAKPSEALCHRPAGSGPDPHSRTTRSRGGAAGRSRRECVGGSEPIGGAPARELSLRHV